MSATGIGAAVRRKEDQRFITGKGHYTDDINRPGQAYACFVRSPHAHATIKSIDTKTAVAMPGVVAIFTGADIAAAKINGHICGWTVTGSDGKPMKAAPGPALANGKVCYVGDEVAVVIADSATQAKDAAEKVVVDYGVLPAVIDPKTAAQPGAPQIHDIAPNNTVYNWNLGDKAATDAAFAAAAHVTKIDLVNNRVAPAAIEPRAAVGEYDSGTDSYTLHTTSQNPHATRLVLSAFSGIAPENKLRVVAPDVGGGFGSKIFIYAEETVCVWAAKKVGRPVKWTAERSEVISRRRARPRSRDPRRACARRARQDHRHAGAHGRQSRRLSVDLLVVVCRLTFMRSSFPGNTTSPTSIARSTRSTPTPLRSTRSVAPDARKRLSWSNAWSSLPRGKPDAIRSPSAGPISSRRSRIRRRCCSAMMPGITARASTRRLLLPTTKALPSASANPHATASCAASAFSTYIEACGLAPSQAVGSLGAGVGLFESAEVRVNPVGTVEVLAGSHAHGQGHETTFAQVVCDRLGIPIENVSVVHGDTDKVQFGMGTYGSRSGPVGISAVVKALDKVVAKAKKVASYLLEAAEGDIEFKDGKFSVAGTDKSIDWVSVSLNAYIAHKFPGSQLEPGLKEGAFFDPTNFTFPAGCHICEVEVDPETGKTEVVAWTAVDDFGTLINPMIVEGQVHGGIAHGIGQALCEGAVYNKDGQLVTGSLMDYCMPRADHLPPLKVDTTVTKCPSNPLGIKGCGEAGAIASPAAVINAITDAIGTEAIAMPATSAAVWAALQKSGRSLPHAA